MILKPILSRTYYFLLKRKLKISKHIIFGKKVKIDRQASLEGYNLLSDSCSLFSSHMGFGSYLGKNTKINKTKVGRFTSIGPDVKIIIGKHPSSNFVSTHPAFFSKRKQIGVTFVENQLFEEFEKPIDREGKYTVVIGNDVWIGDGVSIMEGVQIGDGAIIASNALVTKNVKPYSIVGGVPAKFIKNRFEENEIDFLNNFKWWKKDVIWLKENAAYFSDIKLFMSEMMKG
ncbi:acetyltransferase-like isoleucine patch superfamily enzyme [Seonamhaeicola aphaedonensis]|uniref:Acetyltransferase-like isoleucine patch superfamily enzyme n=1 Tax=Seonamhaeicola aphaedonensis TaxID=1461338 RepID=A0A3D9HHH5_9FLAO|nr:acetyltransferase-like isoleucine patch superfamily enzyme [Seonamhaeicola aphaedonensis]